MKIIMEKSIQTERKSRETNQPVSRWYLLPTVELASGDSYWKPGYVMQPLLTFLSPFDTQVRVSGLGSSLALMRCRKNFRKRVLFQR